MRIVATVIDALRRFGSGRSPSEQFFDDLDDAFGAWSEADEKKGYTDEAVVEIVGAAFGMFCAETLGMRCFQRSAQQHCGSTHEVRRTVSAH